MRRRQQSVALVLFLLKYFCVCKDDDFSALTATKFINENIEKCTMMYRVATRNGIEFFSTIKLFSFGCSLQKQFVGLNCVDLTICCVAY